MKLNITKLCIKNIYRLTNMINLNTINSRISKIRGYIKILKELKDNNKDDFISNYKIYGLAERYLQLSIECLLDISNHIISRLEIKKPETYQDIFIILGINSIIPEKFAKKLAKMAGFRNILVHGYTNIDETIVYNHLQDEIPDFDKFIKYILKFLNQNINHNQKKK